MPPSCALLGGFAIGARDALLWHDTLLVGVEPNCGIEQRVPPIFGRAAITLGIGPHV